MVEAARGEAHRVERRAVAAHGGALALDCLLHVFGRESQLLRLLRGAARERLLKVVREGVAPEKLVAVVDAQERVGAAERARRLRQVVAFVSEEGPVEVALEV